MKRAAAILSFGLWALGVPATAATTSTYSYDPLGRLTTSCAAMSSNAFAFRTVYALDRAGNRQNVNTRDEVVKLLPGDAIWTPDGYHHLLMQSDGNLVLYGPSGGIWATNTVGSGAQEAAMQNDGNLVLYTGTGASIWSSGTAGNYCARLQVQNDGNVVIYSVDDVPIWATNTTGQ